MRYPNVSLAGILAVVFAAVGLAQAASSPAAAAGPTRVSYLISATGLVAQRYGVPVSFEDISSYGYPGELVEWRPEPAIAALNPNRPILDAGLPAVLAGRLYEGA